VTPRIKSIQHIVILK